MSSPTPSFAQPSEQPSPPDPSAGLARPEWAVWFFVGLGVLLRVGRYLLNSPLWWNEAFVAVNVLRRGYHDLLRPLDYGQVCPLLFLWVEKATVDAFGFAEWSLRLFPLLCGLASVFLFARVVRLVCPDRTGWIALALFAVAYHPIRLAAEVKPYASDLLAALVLIWLALEWHRTKQQARWLWRLAGFVPIALAFSHPSVFVAGGLAIAIAPAVARAGRREVGIAFVLYVISLNVGFCGLYLLYTRAQSQQTLNGMRAYWASAFPPLDSMGALARWLLDVHGGRMFAYPGGGDRGASTPTFLLVALGVIGLANRRRWTLLALSLAPFALTFAASVLRRYPYGGHPRMSQHLAPSICLLAGLGLSALIGRIHSPARQRRVGRLLAIGLAGAGVLPWLGEMRHPYRSEYEQQAREFARRFWPEQAKTAELACLRWDSDALPWVSANLDTAVYLCNQAIYSPQRRNQNGPRWNKISHDHPLRYIAFDSQTIDNSDLADWRHAMATRFDLRSVESIPLNRASLGGERIRIFEFVPRAGPVVLGHDRVKSSFARNEDRQTEGATDGGHRARPLEVRGRR